MVATDAVLALKTRRRIYETVRTSPGSHLREIQRAVGLSFGSVSYHLGYLRRHNLIKEEKDGKNNRYLPEGLSSADQKLLGLLRQKSIRGILLLSVMHKEVSVQRLVSSLKLSSSTVNWHLKKLEDEHVIGRGSMGPQKIYHLLIDKDAIIKLLIAYRESFLDAMINNVVELVDLRTKP